MVLIVTDKYDISTSRVIEYLIHFNVNFIRLNKQDEFELLDGIISDSKIDFKFRVNDTTFKYSELSFYWYRRGGLKPFLNTNNPLINFIKVDRVEEEKMLSGPCNYHLDRVIANHIKSEYEKAN